jgi:2-phospho-L-lactate guanylyltransferase (CobY/MobA/RfbA family)
MLASTSDVTLAPTRGGGTALLRLAAGVTLPTQYGPDSARAHIDLARGLDLRAARLELAGAHQDVDGAEDLEALRSALEVGGSHAVGAATASFLMGRRG